MREDIIVMREDLVVTKGELKAAIQGVRSDLDAKIAGLDGRVRVLHWMTGTTLAGTASLLGIAVTIALHLVYLG